MLKNIQISSQRGKQRDIVLPPEDENCRQWWEDLISMSDEFLNFISGESKINHYVKRALDVSDDKLCREKEKLIRGQVKTHNNTIYVKSGTEGSYRGVRHEFGTSFRLYLLPGGVYEGSRNPSVEITIGVEGLLFYDKSARVDYDIENPENLTKLRNLANNISKHIGAGNENFGKTFNYINRNYREWHSKYKISKSIQISGQKGKQRDIILPPEEEEEDCRQWWRDLHSILNEMINAIDMNATLVIDNSVEEISNDELCYAKRKILDAEMDFQGNQFSAIYRKQYSGSPRDLRKYMGFGVNIKLWGMTLITHEGGYISFNTYLGTNGDLFTGRVGLLNDAMRYQLERSVPEYPEAYVFDILEKFSSAELKFKKHINDKTTSLDLTAVLIEFYEDYVREHFDIEKSLQISSQKGKQRDIILPPEEKEENCIERIMAMAEKIKNFRHEDFPENTSLDNEDSLMWIRDVDFRESDFRMATLTLEEVRGDRLDLYWERLENLTEEDACVMLEILSKYLDKTNFKGIVSDFDVVIEDYADVCSIILTDMDLNSDRYLDKFGISITIREGMAAQVMYDMRDIMTP